MKEGYKPKSTPQGTQMEMSLPVEQEWVEPKMERIVKADEDYFSLEDRQIRVGLHYLLRTTKLAEENRDAVMKILSEYGYHDDVVFPDTEQTTNPKLNVEEHMIRIKSPGYRPDGNGPWVEIRA